MWISFVALLLAAVAGQDEALETFRRMEQQVLKCKTFEAQMEVNFPGDPEDIENIEIPKGVKGRLLVARGNKMRWEIDMIAAGRRHKVTTVSDGERMRTIGPGVPRQNDQAPEQLAEIALSSVTRGGIWLTLYAVLENHDPAKEYKDFDPDKSFAVSDFKLGPKEMVAGKEAQVLEYNAKIADQSLSVTVWIDTQTHLPLKRMLKVGPDQDQVIVLTESYTKVVLDENADGKEFEIPK
jgi:outer membrane lipoprotein-sorting protein